MTRTSTMELVRLKWPNRPSPRQLATKNPQVERCAGLGGFTLPQIPTGEFLRTNEIPGSATNRAIEQEVKKDPSVESLKKNAVKTAPLLPEEKIESPSSSSSTAEREKKKTAPSKKKKKKRKRQTVFDL